MAFPLSPPPLAIFESRVDVDADIDACKLSKKEPQLPTVVVVAGKRSVS